MPYRSEGSLNDLLARTAVFGLGDGVRFGLPADQDAPDQDLLILDGLKFLGLFGLLALRAFANKPHDLHG